MTTAKTPITPSYSSDNGSVYPANIDQGMAANSIISNQFQPHQSAVGSPEAADMSITIEGGTLITDSGIVVVAQQVTSLSPADFIAPTTNPRIDRVALDITTGTYVVLTGTEGASPFVPPDYLPNHIPICQILFATVSPVITQITNDMITDERSLIYRGPPVTGYVSGVTEYIESDVGADSTSFNIATNISTTWESVGPTGSGATNIWTALDNVPIGAKYVLLRIYNQAVHSTSAAAQQIVYGRKTGSSTGINNRLVLSYAQDTISGVSNQQDIRIVSECRIPIDTDNRFDLYRITNGNTFYCVAYLMGWGI